METQRGRLRFWTSVDFVPSVTGLIEHLNENGFDARSWSHISVKTYRKAKGLLARTLLRLRMYIVYPLLLFLHILFEKRRSTLHIVCTNPFYAPFIAVLASRLRAHSMRRSSNRCAPVIHWVYDLFPDALIQSGTTRPDAQSTKLIAWIVGQTFRSCTANVFLGEHLLANAQQTYSYIPHAYVLPIGADSTPFRKNHPSSEKTAQRTHDSLTLLYCGNMGLLHDIDTLAAALTHGPSKGFGHRNLHFQFYASGVHYPELCKALSGTHLPRNVTVAFHGSLDTTEWTSVMLQADIALVTMCAGTEKVVMPSKAYSALAAGQAILAICPPDSDLADLVRRHNCGWVVIPESSNAEKTTPKKSHYTGTKGLQRLLEHLSREPTTIFPKQKNAYYAGQNFYDVPMLAERWTALLHEITPVKKSLG